MKKGKKIFAVMVTAAMTVPMAAQVSVQAQEDVSITVFHYMTQASKQAGLDAVETAFAEAHPEYNITWDNVFYNQGTDYFPQLQTALAGGDQPEIIMGNPSNYPDLIEQGYVTDLSDNEAIQAMNFESGDLGDASYKGTLYGFPIDFKTWGVFYNKKLFAEQGIEVPTTHTALLEACQKFADAGIDPWVHAFADAVSGDIETQNYIITKGLDAGDYDLYESLMNGTKKLTDFPYIKEALELWATRMQWMRDDAMTNDQNAALEVFTSGQAAMLYMGTWAVGDLEAMIEGTDFEYGYFVEPIDDEGGARMNVQDDQVFMVNPNSDNCEIAIEFMEYWISEGAESWSAVSWMPLLNGSVSDATPDIVKTQAEIKKSGNIAHYGDYTTQFTTQFKTDWRAALTSFAESYHNGSNMSADEALAEAQKKFDQNIAEAQ